jgi:hypothetical protein
MLARFLDFHPLYVVGCWLAKAKKKPPQIKTDNKSERIKSIISRKFERELPLIAEF